MSAGLGFPSVSRLLEVFKDTRARDKGLALNLYRFTDINFTTVQGQLLSLTLTYSYKKKQVNGQPPRYQHHLGKRKKLLHEKPYLDKTLLLMADYPDPWLDNILHA